MGSKSNDGGMRYTAVILALIAPIWLVKPLCAEGSLYDESVKYLEDNAHCMAVFAALLEPENDALRSQLELEVDDEYYSSEAVEQRMEKYIKFLGKKLATPLGELISEVELNDIFLNL